MKIPSLMCSGVNGISSLHRHHEPAGAVLSRVTLERLDCIPTRRIGTRKLRFNSI